MDTPKSNIIDIGINWSNVLERKYALGSIQGLQDRVGQPCQKIQEQKNHFTLYTCSPFLVWAINEKIFYLSFNCEKGEARFLGQNICGSDLQQFMNLVYKELDSQTGISSSKWYNYRVNAPLVRIEDKTGTLVATAQNDPVRLFQIGNPEAIQEKAIFDDAVKVWNFFPDTMQKPW